MRQPILFVFLLLSFFLFSCGNDDDKEVYSLTFEKDSYETGLGFSYNIPVLSGNGDYTVAVEDEDILSAESFIGEDLGAGQIHIYAKKKGETFVHITDNRSGDEVTLKIKVTDAYLPGIVLSSNHPLLSAGQYLYLVKNDANDFYIFTKNPSQDDLSLAIQGNYDFVAEDNKDNEGYLTGYLIFNYQDAGMGSQTYKFDISSDPQNSYAINLLTSFFEIKWEKSVGGPPPAPLLKLKEENTDLEIVLQFSSFLEIPEGILN
jgi:hypothetical protein